jgi:hypothetical protein
LGSNNTGVNPNSLGLGLSYPLSFIGAGTFSRTPDFSYLTSTVSFGSLAPVRAHHTHNILCASLPKACSSRAAALFLCDAQAHCLTTSQDKLDLSDLVPL